MQNIKWLLFILILLGYPSITEGAERAVTEGESIQKAIAEAEAGDVLHIKQGIYHENLQVDKRITLRGEDGAIIDGSGDGHVVQVLASGVRVEGLTIQNSGMSNEDAGIYVYAHGVQLGNNELINTLVGIYVKHGKGTRIISNKIKGNDEHFSKRGNGIYLFHTTDTKLIHNKIMNVQDGVYFDFAEDTLASGNTVTDSRYGMHLMFSKRAEVSRNTLSKNINGLMVMSSQDVSISQNELSHNLHYRGYGIYLYEVSAVKMTENQIFTNSTGVGLQYVQNSILSENIMMGNHVGIELEKDNQQIALKQNIFSGNVVTVKHRTKKAPLGISGEENYWEDYKGFDLDYDGKGDTGYFIRDHLGLLIEKQPYYQFYFGGPSLMLVEKVEELFPTEDPAMMLDQTPAISHVSYEFVKKQEREKPLLFLFIGLGMIAGTIYLFYKGRNVYYV